MKYQVYEVRDQAHNQGICLATDYCSLRESFDEGRGFRSESGISSVVMLGEIELDEKTLEKIADNSLNGIAQLRFFAPTKVPSK